MRAFAAVLRWLSAGVLALSLLLAAALQAKADTGTYRIADYSVTLEAQSSGQVKMTYEQTWRVLSGNIPWVTVGLPNADFQVEDPTGGAAVHVYADNAGGFTGVRADLDRAYLPGESFTIGFTVLQSNLLERLTQDKKWRINFTPGWYDRAVIDRLEVTLVSPVDLSTYSSVQPMPFSTADRTMTWTWSGLSAGSRVKVNVECLDGSFLAASVPVGPAKSGSNPWIVPIIIVIAVVFVALIVFAVRRSRQARNEALKERIAATEREMAENAAKKEEIEKGFREYVITEDMQPDEQGRYYDQGYGGYITPAIWAAVIMGQQSRQTGAACACVACACVACACACACACAGGGAAGCSRKTLHQCRQCLKIANAGRETGTL